MKNIEYTEYKSIAIRYAKALDELCISHSTDKNIILEDLKTISDTLKSSSELVNLMKSPGVSKADKQKVINKIFSNKINKITMNFLLFLIEKDRFNIVESIYYEYKSELDKQNNYIQIEIVSAVDLKKETKEIITNKLSEKLQKKLNVDWAINPDIIAGLVFIVGDSIIDTSVKSQLEMIGRNIIK